jgi:hypothetical protein
MKRRLAWAHRGSLAALAYHKGDGQQAKQRVNTRRALCWTALYVGDQP